MVPALSEGMVHPYTPYCRAFAYRGRYSYLLTFVTHARTQVFTCSQDVELVWAQFVRAASEKDFEIVAYCFMHDHVHLVTCGLADDSDLKAFVKLAKQYAGFHFARAHDRRKLWQHGSNDHIVRDEVDLRDR